MRQTSFGLALLLAGSLVGAGALAAPPKAGTAFEDWSVECEAVEKGEKCFISQTLNIKESNGRLIKASIGYFGPKGEPTVVALFPLGIWLPAGTAFSVGDQPQAPMTIQQCTPQGCLAVSQLKPDQIKALEGGKAMRFGMLPAGTKDTLVVTLSAKGLAAGLAAVK